MNSNEIYNHKIIINNYKKDYIIREDSSDLYLYKSITEQDLFKKDILNSKILECVYNNTILECDTYLFLILYIYKSMNKKKIAQNTILSIGHTYNESKSDQFMKILTTSIQNSDDRLILKEIINMIRVCNYVLELKIQLDNEEIYWFKI